MLELRENKEKNYFDIVIDGKFYDQVYAHGKDFLKYFSKNQEASIKLSNLTLGDFPPFETIWLENIFTWLDFTHLVLIVQSFEDAVQRGRTEVIPNDQISISFTFEPQLLHWNKEYSFDDYAKEFGRIWQSKDRFGAYRFYTDDRAYQFDITIKTEKFNSTIAEFLGSYETVLKEVHGEVSAKLSKEAAENIIATSFQFAEELKIPCQQYLLYFAQFLKDIGINATSNLREDAGKVLFSVTPTDDIEALDRIREALVIYLNLPSSPIIYDDSFAAMRLKREIESLQHAQRMTEIELKSTSYALQLAQQNIENQQILNQQQAKLIERITSKSVMIDSAENKEELEKIYDGLEVGESKFIKEQIGIKFNPAKIIKTAVKNTLGKGDEIIELGLNKKDGE